MTGVDVVDAELELARAHLGRPPPVDVVARLTPRDGRGWSFTASVPEARAGDVRAWLARVGGTRARVAESAVGASVHAVFDALPGVLVACLSETRVRSVHFLADGRVRARVVAARARVRALAERYPGTRVRRCAGRSADRDRLLTPRQEEVLAMAVEEGYYHVPRAITLVHLAEKCGVSTSSLSELLRRAEARVITRFAENGPAAWGGEDGARALPPRP